MAQRATGRPPGLLSSSGGGGSSGDSKSCARCLGCRAGNACASLSIGDRRCRPQFGLGFGRAKPTYARCDPCRHRGRHRRRAASLRQLRPASSTDRRRTRSAGGESRSLKAAIASSSKSADGHPAIVQDRPKPSRSLALTVSARCVGDELAGLDLDGVKQASAIPSGPLGRTPLGS
jgi:hypothetical protein